MVYVFLADGFEEVEAIAPIDILRRASVDVFTVGVGTMTPQSVRGIRVFADMAESDVVFGGLDGIVLPGGKLGTENLEKSETVQKAVDYCVAHQLLIGAICAAPSILGHKNLLAGKQATAFPEFQEELAGALPSQQYVCRDGNYITARGAGVSLEFGFALAAAFAGQETADELRNAMQCER